MFGRWIENKTHNSIFSTRKKKPLSLLLHRNCNRSVWRKRCNSSRKKKIVDFHGSVVYVCRSLSIVLFRLSLLLLLLRCFFCTFWVEFSLFAIYQAKNRHVFFCSLGDLKWRCLVHYSAPCKNPADVKGETVISDTFFVTLITQFQMNILMESAHEKEQSNCISQALASIEQKIRRRRRRRHHSTKFPLHIFQS